MTKKKQYPKSINTKWGRATIKARGYYYISTDEKGFKDQPLHRLIYEDEVGPIPEGYIIHHVDENPLNNEIDNLQCLSKEIHMELHMRDRKRLRKNKSKQMYERYLILGSYAKVGKEFKCSASTARRRIMEYKDKHNL